jgi:hypothetical protein
VGIFEKKFIPARKFPLNICYAKSQFWFKFAFFQLSTSIVAAKNRGFFRDFRKCNFKTQSPNAPRFAISFKIANYFGK